MPCFPKEIYEVAGNSDFFAFGTEDLCNAAKRSGRWNEDHSEAQGGTGTLEQRHYIARFPKSTAKGGGIGAVGCWRADLHVFLI
jgi:hypothetical protein